MGNMCPRQYYAGCSQLRNMSFDEGMRLFRSGDVPGACEQFHQAVEQDENNHKAWNALGICLSKTGEHEDADTCFENALMLDPGNSTYERNREKNDTKRPVNWPVVQKREAKEDPKPYSVSAPVEKPLSFYFLTAAKLLGGFLLFCFICVFVAAFVFGMSDGATAKTKESASVAGSEAIIQPAQQVTAPPAPTKYEFSGAAAGSTDFFYLNKGMADVKFTVLAEYYNGGSLKTDEGKTVDLLINQAKPGTGNKKVRIPQTGQYYIDMYTADWSLTITQ